MRNVVVLANPDAHETLNPAVLRRLAAELLDLHMASAIDLNDWGSASTVVDAYFGTGWRKRSRHE